MADVRFGAGLSAAATAHLAAREAVERARAGIGDATPRLALVFGSVGYDDLPSAAVAVAGALGCSTPVAGASSGGALFVGTELVRRGLLVVLLAGEGLSVAVESVGPLADRMGEVERAAGRLRAQAARAAGAGLVESTILVLATPFGTDAEEVVAAVRRGVGPEAQLAGGLAGDDFRFERAFVFHQDRVLEHGAVLASLSTARAIGIGVRHGWRPVSRQLRITAARGAVLQELEGRPALDVWLEEVRRAGGDPGGRSGPELALFLANHWELGVGVAGKEPVVRAPFSIGARGEVELAAAFRPGLLATVMHATPEELLQAAAASARDARQGVGPEGPVGGLVFSCSGRVTVLGDAYPREISTLAEALEVPVAGLAVYGEIARPRGHVDSFHNTTCVTLAVPS